MDYPLSDLRVLDLSRVLAGPFAGRMLSDLGAEVVKVEPPEKDVTRNWGRKIESISGYYHQQNAGKKNISVDLTKPKGTSLLLELAKHADILLENFRPGVMSRLGLDWNRLHDLNPRLIMLSISGFGQEGPEARRAAYAPIVHAETGAISRQAAKSNSAPTELSMSFADTNAGLHGLVALLAAVHQRERTNLGQHIDIAMVDAMLATDDHVNYYLENMAVDNGVSEIWEATGGHIIIAGHFRHTWNRLNRVLDLADPASAETPLEKKIQLRRDATFQFLNSFSSRLELTTALDKANLAWGDVKTTDTYLAESETLRTRRSIIEIDDRSGGTRPTFQSPYRFSDANSGVSRGAPRQGEHNQEILNSWLQYSSAQVEELIQEGTLISNP